LSNLSYPDSTSAEDLLSSELLPRKIELERKYLEEALELLTTSQVSTIEPNKMIYSRLQLIACFITQVGELSADN
jgi:hypothetical protein